jgi:hypothetical protein
MSKPHRCPHIAMTGNICVYCPGGPDSDFEYSTQSYTGYEPTSMRAIRARYDPYEQARGRIDQLRVLGHNVDKVPTLGDDADCRWNTSSWAEHSCPSPTRTATPSSPNSTTRSPVTPPNPSTKQSNSANNPTPNASALQSRHGLITVRRHT